MRAVVRRFSRLLLALTLGALLVACNADLVTKSGAPADPRVKTLTMLVPTAGQPEASSFVKAVAARSGGRLKVVIDNASYNDASPQREQLVVGGIRNGQAELGFIAGRNFTQAGDQGFAALQTPFLITTVEAAARATKSAAAADILEGLKGAGVVGLALVADEPRQLLTTRPIFDSDLKGARIRVVDNDQSNALIRALGGIPINELRSIEVGPLLQSGKLDGVESVPTYILINSYAASARFLSQQALFPKINAIVANERAWGQLDDEERSAIQQAATDTRDQAVLGVADRERAGLAKLCRSGVVVTQPESATLKALQKRGQQAAPQSARAESIARELAAELPTTSPGQGPIDLPPECRVARSARQATAMASAEVTPIPSSKAGTLPPGTYVTTITAEEFAQGGVYGPDWEKDIVFTTIMRPDRTFYGSQGPDYPDQGPVSGTYAVDGDQLTFTFERGGLLPEVVRWSYFDGDLTLSVVDVPDPGSRVIYNAHPWRRVR